MSPIVRLLAGQALAVLYIRAVFGGCPVPGSNTKHLAITKHFGRLPFKIIDGSLYVGHFRVHHWLIFLCLLPLFVHVKSFVALGFATVMIVQGLWYDDRFKFVYWQSYR